MTYTAFVIVDSGSGPEQGGPGATLRLPRLSGDFVGWILGYRRNCRT